MNAIRLLLVCASVGCLSIEATTMLPPLRDACAQRAPKVSYSEDITPIFKGYCESCHRPGGQGYAESGLDLTSYDGVMKGTKFGPMVTPGKPEESNLYVLLTGQAKIRMPYGHKPLPICLVNAIYSWIFEGAKNN
jgi:Planctomycete cytochrome C